MPRENLNDLSAFLTLAEELSFTKAAAKLGVSQSALSYTIRQLEDRMGIRLVTRTTRSVSLTDAGVRLAHSVGPHLEQIESELAALAEMKDKPAGTIRITSGEHAVEQILLPALETLLPEYPDIKVEVTVDYGLTDIVAERYDAGIRMGAQIAKDMIAVRIGPDLRMAILGAPSYFDIHGTPETPQDLVRHNCINLRLPTHGGLYPWELDHDGGELRVRVDGQLIFNSAAQIISAARRGLGLACLPRDIAEPYFADGSLRSVMDDWFLPFPGYHLFYPSRRQNSPAFALLVNALRYKGPNDRMAM